MLRNLALALSLLLVPSSIMAQDAPTSETTVSEPLKMRVQDVVALLKEEKAPEDVFGPQFLASVPPAQFNAVTQQLTSQFGAAIGIENIEPTGEFTANIAIRFEKAIGQGTLALSSTEPHKIEGLLLRQFDAIDDSLTKIEADLAALPGKVGVYYGPISGDAPVLSINPDEQFAIGSAFKLYVLAALAEDVRAGERSWDKVVTLTEKSFPSGMMQDWRRTAPVTLHTLASLMISISDNTATDQLIKELGRDRVLRAMVESGHSDPSKNDPFLTTREMFALKGGPKQALEAYQAESNGDRRLEMLEQLEAASITAEEINSAFATGPVALDVEWFASANDLRKLLQRIYTESHDGALSIMGINPSMSDNLRNQWRYVGYKGGSEPGVLNLTWFLADESGNNHVLVLSWNNPDAALDNTASELIAQRILALPR